ncbi:MAG TPA: LytTR family DNA-binding domain-containing protein, partial [Gemmatimonadales bacterium]|nr:LytTR family DNA-binding domain-containing protein [Gemmatimonadales bacterium]
MKTVLIADDERLARLGIRQQLERHRDYRVIAEAGDGEAAARLIREGSPDVVFLDIAMPLLSGFDVVAAVGQSNMPAFIFVTAYDQHALKAFEVNAIDYLLKPIDPQRFDEALRRSEERRRTEDAYGVAQRLEQLIGVLENRLAVPGTPAPPRRIPVREGGKVLLLDVDQIIKVEAEGNYLMLSIDGRTHQVRESLQAFLSRAGPGSFTRIHRSIAVNRTAVRAIETFGKGTYVLTLRDGNR